MESPGTASNGSVTQQSSQHGPPNGGGGGMHGNTTVPGGDDDTPNGWNCSMHPSVFFLLGTLRFFFLFRSLSSLVVARLELSDVPVFRRSPNFLTQSVVCFLHSLKKL